MCEYFNEISNSILWSLGCMNVLTRFQTREVNILTRFQTRFGLKVYINVLTRFQTREVNILTRFQTRNWV